MTRRRATALGLLAVAIALPWLLRAAGADYYLSLASRVLVAALAATSLNLLLGYGGMVSLGHAAFVGLGAYASGVLLSEGVTGAGWHLVVTVLVTGLAALAIGAVALRTRGVYFIMVTLAFSQMAYFVFHDTGLAGGSDGLFLAKPPTLGPLDAGNRRQFYELALAALAFTYALLALLRRSRFGHALAGIRVNEQRMRAAGFPTTLYKLAAFVIAGALAGLAGCLLALKNGAVNPELLSWHESGAVLLMIILGGVGHLRGAVIGALAFVLLKELYSTPAVVGDFLAGHWPLTLGLTIIAFVALLPRGLIGLFERRPR